MKLAAGPPLYHSTETAFPYSAAGVVNITGTTDFVDPTANYYYFYDWQIETEFVCGRSAIEVDFQNSPNKPEAEFTPSATTIPLVGGTAEVSFANSTLNGETYFWDFGDGTTSTDENPTHTYTAEGIYTCLLYTSPSPRDLSTSRMPSSA